MTPATLASSALTLTASVPRWQNSVEVDPSYESPSRQCPGGVNLTAVYGYSPAYDDDTMQEPVGLPPASFLPLCAICHAAVAPSFPLLLALKARRCTRQAGTAGLVPTFQVVHAAIPPR